MEAPWGQEPPGFCSLLTPTCLVLWDWDPSKPWRHFRRYSEGKETRTEEGNVSVEGNATPVTFKLCPLDHQQQEKPGASYRCEFSGLAPGLTNRKALSWGSAGLKCLVMELWYTAVWSLALSTRWGFCWVCSGKENVGIGELVQWLRWYTAITGDLCSIPNTPVRPLTTACKPSFRGSDTSGHPNHMYIRTCIINKSFKNPRNSGPHYCDRAMLKFRAGK